MKMQKGLCVKMKNGRSVFLIEDGRFLEGRAVNPIEIGEEGYFVPASRGFNLALSKIIAPVAALAAVLIFLFATMMPSEEAYAYIQMEVNPGIELGVDEDIHVISIRGLNDDGKALIERLGEWKGHMLDEILARSISLAATSSADTVTITMVAEDLDETSAAPVEKTVMAVSMAALQRDVKIHLKKATLDQWRKSVKEDVPVGQKVKKYTPIIKEEKSDALKNGSSGKDDPIHLEEQLKKSEPPEQKKKEILPKPKKEAIPPIKKEKTEPAQPKKDPATKKPEKKAAPKTKAPEKVKEKKAAPMPKEGKTSKKPKQKDKQSSKSAPLKKQ